MSTGTAPLAPQKARPQAKGTQREMGEEMGWLLRRTKRVEELIAQPAIMDLADRVARHMERYAFEEGVRPQDLDVSVLAAQTKSYVRVVFGRHACEACQMSGKALDGVHYCPVCDGAGHW